MKRLLKNKKGLLGDVFNWIGNLFQTITQTLPKPVLFLIFLFILLILGNLLTYAFNLFGIFCNTGELPVKLDSNPVNNVLLATEMPDISEIGKEAMNVEDFPISSPTVGKCSRQFPEGTKIELDEGGTFNLNSSTWFYDGNYCTDCRVATIIEKDPITGWTGSTYRFCYGNVEYKNNDEKTWLQRTLCGSWACEPPKSYYYDYRTNKYLCNDNTCAGRTIGDEWNAKLNRYNAKPLYDTAEGNVGKGYDKMLGITCKELRPRLSVWGIDIFDYKLWSILLILGLLFWAWKSFFH